MFFKECDGHYPKFEDFERLWDLAFLLDIAEKLKRLNLQIQGQDKCLGGIISDVQVFSKKLELLEKNLSQGDSRHFPCKTKILDKLRRTNVQDGEAGGITQQIGATNVPIEAIKEQTKIVKGWCTPGSEQPGKGWAKPQCKPGHVQTRDRRRVRAKTNNLGTGSGHLAPSGFSEVELRIPGLLIIDTPGHESFSNLRSRGSSLCDIAILVVDIMHGLEPQTIESLNLLKTKKTPFIVALNKIDRLYDWQTMNRKDVRDILKVQAPNTQLEFEQRTKEVIVQFAEQLRSGFLKLRGARGFQGLNAALFHENPDIRSYVSLVPTSAITGEGMGNLLALIVESCQNMLAKRLMYSEELQATVLEVKAIPGLGTTIDAILINGRLREGDTMILAGTDGPIVTQIRSLLMPQPMKELRVKNAYVEYKEIKAAQGVKIAAKELEKAIAGLNMQVAQKPDEVDLLREEVARELKHALSNIKLQDRGVYVQASTLGSLEALLEFLRTSKIPGECKPLIKYHPPYTRPDLKPDIPVIDSPVYFENDALDHQPSKLRTFC
uniref:Tr-type G domain-containing protein n=1 Tax=Timema poppense TaxID=170557 RepID=A0A7R9CNX2_TIMPO|nr:unnamed protein product [Timema poppensis]